MTNKETEEERLLKLASVWHVENVGMNRREDGALPGWHSWAKVHSQREDDILICRGRDEFRAGKTLVAFNTDDCNGTFSVVSWNLLSDAWMKKQSAEGDYDHTPPEQREWKFRLDLLLEWIDKMDPDILALQEVDYSCFENDLQKELQARGYHGRMQQPKKRAARQPCGNATFWKNKSFQLLHHISHSRTFCTVLEATAASIGRGSEETLPKICVANVHLESSQSELGSDRRARQLNSALSWAASEAPNNAALIVCGDCNTGADSQLFRVLREHQWHGHNFSSVYEHPSTAETLPNYATFLVPGHHYSIDHILYAQDTLSLKCVLDALLPQERIEHIHSKGQLCGFPSAFCPSDHIPVGAVFEMLPQINVVIAMEEAEQQLAKLSPDREEALTKEWEDMQSKNPPISKGKPSPEEIAERRKFSAAVKAWKQTVQGQLEEEFVAKLTKTKK